MKYYQYLKENTEGSKFQVLENTECSKRQKAAPRPS